MRRWLMASAAAVLVRGGAVVVQEDLEAAAVEVEFAVSRAAAEDADVVF